MAKKKKDFLRYIPFLLLVAVAITAYFMGFHRYFTFHFLKQKHEMLLSYVEAHPFLAPGLFILTFFLLTCFLLPIADVMGVIGGYLFPFPCSSLFILLGATSGGVVVFLAAHTAFGDLIKKRAGPFLKKVERGFQRNAWSYLLFLRFVPIFPSWLVNTVPAFLGITLKTFFWTTVIGLIPVSILHAQIGAGLHEIFEKHEHFSFKSLLNTRLEIALLILGIIALIPILVKKGISSRK